MGGKMTTETGGPDSMNRRAFLRRGAECGAGVAIAGTLARGREVQAAARKTRPLKQVGSPCGLRIGAQADRGPLQDPGFARLIKDNFNLLTPGNHLKFGQLRPRADIFFFDDADWIVKFAQDNDLLIHGHNLCTNDTGKSWLDEVLTQGNARRYLTEHISTVVGRYRGKIDSWDVVNEPVVPWSRRSDGLYPGIWLNMLGTAYIDIAFNATAEADPSALRVLNIHHVELDTPDEAKNRMLALSLVRQLVQRRVPIQAVGIESHLTGGEPMAGTELVHFVTEIRAMGLQVLITELDVNDTKLPGDEQLRDEAVGKYYHDYITQVVPGADVRNLIFWTPCDRWNWLNRLTGPAFQRTDGQLHRPGLFDRNMEPKLAFEATSSAIAAVCKH